MLKKIMITGGLICNSLYAFNLSICKVLDHEAIDAVVAGIKDSLKDDDDIKYDIESCQADMALGYQIATKFVNSKADVIVAIGTTPSQCVFKFAKKNKAKLVFASVTEPNDISKYFKDCNTTGVSNFIDLAPQLKLFKKLQPNLKNLGILYSSSESNSVSIIKKLEIACKEEGIELVKQSIQKSSDIPQAIAELRKKVDAVFITNDNTALGGIPYIVKACDKVKIPVYVSDTDQVAKGCLAALGPNQYELGKQTGKLIKKIKDGADINDMPIEYPDTMELYINETKAAELGIKIPDDILKEAKIKC